MYGGILQTKIQYGYAKCATKIGSPFLLYRSPNPLNPIQPHNLVGVILSSSNVSWDYMNTQKYGKAVWNMIIDTMQVSPIHAEVGDYLMPIPGYYFDNGGFNVYQTASLNQRVNGYATDTPPFYDGFFEDNSVYFIGAIQYLLPILGVQCNRYISVIRPTQITGDGYKGYSEYLPSTSETICTNMPASVLEVGSDGTAPTKLPTDTKQPRWIILIPNLGDVIIRVDDIVVDDLNQEYVITDNELTSLGWRILAEQVVNSR